VILFALPSFQFARVYWRALIKNEPKSLFEKIKVQIKLILHKTMILRSFDSVHAHMRAQVNAK